MYIQQDKIKLLICDNDEILLAERLNYEWFYIKSQPIDSSDLNVLDIKYS